MECAALKKFKYPYDPRAFSNPYDPIQDPHMHWLIAVSVCYGETASNFRNDYWKPFVNAFDLWVKAFHGPNWRIYYAKEKRLYYTSGNGRNRGLIMSHLSKEEIRHFYRK